MVLFSDTINLDEITRDSMSTLNRVFDDLRLPSVNNTNFNQELSCLQESLNAWQIRCERSVAKVLRSAKACSDCFHCFNYCLQVIQLFSILKKTCSRLAMSLDLDCDSNLLFQYSSPYVLAHQISDFAWYVTLNYGSSAFLRYISSDKCFFKSFSFLNQFCFQNNE